MSLKKVKTDKRRTKFPRGKRAGVSWGRPSEGAACCPAGHGSPPRPPPQPRPASPRPRERVAPGLGRCVNAVMLCSWTETPTRGLDIPWVLVFSCAGCVLQTTTCSPTMSSGGHLGIFLSPSGAQPDEAELSPPGVLCPALCFSFCLLLPMASASMTAVCLSYHPRWRTL